MRHQQHALYQWDCAWYAPISAAAGPGVCMPVLLPVHRALCHGTDGWPLLLGSWIPADRSLDAGAC